MAYTQVELAPSSPFGCVLRDHNRSRDSAAAAYPRKLVRGRVVDENCHHGVDHVERDNKKMNNQYKKLRCSLHVSDVVHNDKFDESYCCMSPSQRENLACDDEVSNLGASSLVQIWEARLRRSSSGGGYSRSNSGCSDNASLVDEDVKVSECVVESVEEKCDDQAGNEEMSERDVSRDDSMSKKSDGLDSLEIERVRVADIVKRWSSADNENESPSPGNSPLMRFCGCDQRDQRVFAHIISSPRIRGRQAFNDLLMSLERDRHRELEALANRHVVSKFPQKGRIQSMLRLKVLQRGLAAKVQAQSQDRTSFDRIRPSQGSHIMQLRERFKTGVEQGATASCGRLNPKSPQKESIMSNQRECSSASKLYEDRCHQDTCILMKSRERFQARNERGTEVPVSEVNPESQEEIKSKNTQHKSEIFSPGPLKEESCHQDVITSDQQSTSSVQHPSQPPDEEIIEEPNSSSDTTCQELCSEACHLNSQDPRDDLANPWHGTSWDSGIFYPEEDTPDIMYLNDWEENEASEDDDDEGDDDQLMETNYDWISDIARPKSYWEECRQARYQEVLSTDSSKEEIRRLLERGTVSNFLTSDLRDRIDQLMESRLQVTFQASIQDEEDNKERLEQMMRSLQRDKPSVGTGKERREGEHGEMERIDIEGQVESPMNRRQHEISEGEVVSLVCQQGDESSAEVTLVKERHPYHSRRAVDNADDEMENVQEGAGNDYLDQYHEASDYFDQSTSLFQMPSPSQSSSWSYEVREDSDQAVSSTSNPLLQSESYYQDIGHATLFPNHSSIGMEIINDLRGKMDLLQQEIIELRRSIKFCLDMQLEMQQSFKHEVHSATMEGGNALNKRRRKGRCCVCNEMQVDSLLYRCGHMCTCFKCASELQWSSGKCPICHAPIDDVVKASSCS